MEYYTLLFFVASVGLFVINRKIEWKLKMERRMTDTLKERIELLYAFKHPVWNSTFQPPLVDGFYLVYNASKNTISKALYESNSWHCLESEYGDELIYWTTLPDKPTIV